jgi:hypothetical protein
VEAIFWKKKKGNSPRELGSAIGRGETDKFDVSVVQSSK